VCERRGCVRAYIKSARHAEPSSSEAMQPAKYKAYTAVFVCTGIGPPSSPRSKQPSRVHSNAPACRVYYTHTQVRHTPPRYVCTRTQTFAVIPMQRYYYCCCLYIYMRVCFRRISSYRPTRPRVYVIYIYIRCGESIHTHTRVYNIISFSNGFRAALSLRCITGNRP